MADQGNRMVMVKKRAMLVNRKPFWGDRALKS
jgi:hypothetical protein